jgi:hypothetical protein
VFDPDAERSDPTHARMELRDVPDLCLILTPSVRIQHRLEPCCTESA